MASSLTSLSLAADPLLEQKENIIRELKDENLELRLELESLRVGFRDGPPFTLFRVSLELQFEFEFAVEFAV
jgi:hypothetical protein